MTRSSETAGTHRILIEGDGAAYGMGDETGAGWAGRLKADSLTHNLQYPESPIVVYNLAEPDHTITRVLHSASSSRGPNLLPSVSLVRILSVGVLDSSVSAVDSKPRVTPDAFQRALTTFNTTSASIGARTVFVGPNPVNETQLTPDAMRHYAFDNARIAEYNEMVADHAHGFHAPYIDVMSMFKGQELAKVINYGGVYPNHFGHHLIYARVVSELSRVMSYGFNN